MRRFALIILVSCGRSDLAADFIAAPSGSTIVSVDAGCFPKANNPPQCPATWQEARTACQASLGCGVFDAGCRFPGLGDILTGQDCPADGVAVCLGGVWRCAQ